MDFKILKNFKLLLRFEIDTMIEAGELPDQIQIQSEKRRNFKWKMK